MPKLSREDIQPDGLKGIEAEELSDILSADFTEEEKEMVKAGNLDLVFHVRNYLCFKERENSYAPGTWLAIYCLDKVDPVIAADATLEDVGRKMDFYLKNHKVKFQHVLIHVTDYAKI
ncbi:hypothetical protein HY638_04985 [Candidatus Woesearchaeota archaeon]|nr:hypothetical protein [Candidatus Woesearchaeota archaeon]